VSDVGVFIAKRKGHHPGDDREKKNQHGGGRKKERGTVKRPLESRFKRRAFEGEKEETTCRKRKRLYKGKKSKKGRARSERGNPTISRGETEWQREPRIQGKGGNGLQYQVN